METRHLRVFVTVYKTRSFTRAAEVLYTSQPTISEHMRNLEERLGCKLFDRLGRSISPTPEADLLYPQAVNILDEMQRLEESLAAAATSVSGELVIGASTIPGAYILPALAAQFKKKYPAVSFEIRINDSAGIISSVAGHEMYFGVVGSNIPTPKVSFAPLCGDELVLAASSDADIEDEISLEDLKNYDFLIREKGSGTGRTVAARFKEQGIDLAELRIQAVLGSTAAIKEAIKSGLGVSILSRTAIRDELAHGMLREVSIRGLNMRRNLYIVSIDKRTLPHHYQVFLTYLKSQGERSRNHER
jgi:DNA-binding transcriptional LysR family regulator